MGLWSGNQSRLLGIRMLRNESKMLLFFSWTSRYLFGYFYSCVIAVFISPFLSCFIPLWFFCEFVIEICPFLPFFFNLPRIAGAKKERKGKGSSLSFCCRFRPSSSWWIWSYTNCLFFLLPELHMNRTSTPFPPTFCLIATIGVFEFILAFWCVSIVFRLPILQSFYRGILAIASSSCHVVLSSQVSLYFSLSLVYIHILVSSWCILLLLSIFILSM